jgi:membrane protein DedA with SNARE-associated domain
LLVLDKDLIYELVGWFAFLVSAGFGLPPLPEEVLITSGGVRAAAIADQYHGFQWLLMPVVIAGAFVADIFLYMLGRVFGQRLLEMKWMQKLAPPRKREHIHDNFHHYGFTIFLVGRLLPGIRTTLFLTAGTMRLNLLRFCLADGLGAVFGGSLLFFLGYGLGSHFLEMIEKIEKRIAPYKAILVLIVLGSVALYLLYAFLRRPVPTGDPEDVPIIGHQIATHLPDKSVSPPAQAPQERAPSSQSGSKTEARG